MCKLPTPPNLWATPSSVLLWGVWIAWKGVWLTMSVVELLVIWPMLRLGVWLRKWPLTHKKLDVLMNLVTQFASNQKFACVARLCGICLLSDHYIDAYPYLQQLIGPNAPQVYIANIYNNNKIMICPITSTI